jgi:hypothetical protein
VERALAPDRAESRVRQAHYENLIFSSFTGIAESIQPHIEILPPSSSIYGIPDSEKVRLQVRFATDRGSAAGVKSRGALTPSHYAVTESPPYGEAG